VRATCIDGLELWRVQELIVAMPFHQSPTGVPPQLGRMLFRQDNPAQTGHLLELRRQVCVGFASLGFGV
jgi:hypothetical protein